MKPAHFLLSALILAACAGRSPTEPAALARYDPSEPRTTPSPTPTPHLVEFGLPRVSLKPTPCFATPFTDCEAVPRPTLAPGWPTPTPDAGNLAGGIIPGTSHVTIWPDPTPTP